MNENQPSTLARLARTMYRRRRLVLLAWILAIAGAFALSSAFSGDFEADYTAPGSDSRQAQELLGSRFPARSGEVVNVVVRADAGVSTVSTDVRDLLARMKNVPHVVRTEDPYTTPGSIAEDGRTLIARLRLDVDLPVDMPPADAQRLIDLGDQAERSGVEIAVGGAAIQTAESGAIGSEGIGLLAAVVILLLMFGSVVAAGLPILVALAGLALSSSLTGLLLYLVDAPDWSTSLATMMGIGIGIDYVLLMVTRFREWRAAGLELEAAAVATVDTAGRSVLVAGSTVMISMLGLFAMGLSFMRGAALVTILAVAVVMIASLTLLPALLGFLGRQVDRLRVPLGRRAPVAVAAGGHVEPSPRWRAWSRLVGRHRVVAAGAGVTILLLLAAPFLDVRFGFPDAGNNREETSTRQAYDMTADAFGAGANGPLVLVADLPPGTSLDPIRDSVESTQGVAAVLPPQLNPAGDTAVLTVLPTTGPQDPRTEDLVRTLRDTTAPAATEGTGVDINIGGSVPRSIDSTDNIADRLPLLITGVVLLSMLLLLLAFRSIAVAVKAAVMNLLSVAAAYGVIALVLQGGWAGQLIGIDTPTPLPAFVPVLMFAVLFGLSMDYEVFLVSRTREAWLRSHDNSYAVTDGLAGTGRVITAAAAIMVAVFAAFIPSTETTLKLLGVGMAAAILLDATVIRMLLVPAVMQILGRANWWMPHRLNRLLPDLHVEGQPGHHLPEDRSPVRV
jgi:putative drug exporter of the RND superfamily